MSFRAGGTAKYKNRLTGMGCVVMLKLIKHLQSIAIPTSKKSLLLKSVTYQATSAVSAISSQWANVHIINPINPITTSSNFDRATSEKGMLAKKPLNHRLTVFDDCFFGYTCQLHHCHGRPLGVHGKIINFLLGSGHVHQGADEWLINVELPGV